MNKKDLSRFGKKFIVEAAGVALSDHEKVLLERLQPAGIILRSRNFLQGKEYDIWLEQYKALLKQVREILPHKNLIISIDHEGGRVIRPPDPITKFPYAAKWLGSVKEVAESMSVELQSLAINLNFAPVADIHSNPQNPVIADRSFGNNASVVTKAASELARVLKANGIVPCAKHFPGHGDTKTDSHFGLPVLELSLDELRKRELLPFQALIDEGLQMIMTAHILFPKIDPDNIATLSKTILDDLLRKEMGFNGVVIADGMGMAAISGNLSNKETVIKAIKAGLDIFLMVGDNITINHTVKLAELIKEAVDNKEIKEEELVISESRIDKLVSTLPQYTVSSIDNNILAKHHRLAQRLSTANNSSEFELNLPGFD